jgi:peroxiredoxin
MGFRLQLLIPLVVLASACSSTPARIPALGAEPAPLPDVKVVTLSGEGTTVPKVAGGRVALVSLWATWCDACAKEIDSLNRLDAKSAGEGDVVVIGLAVGESPETVASFAQRRRLRYVQLVDESFSFADALGGERRLPATLVLDRQGRVVFRGDALDSNSLEALRKALAAPLLPREGASANQAP